MDYQHIAVFLIGNDATDAEVKQAQQREQRYGDFRLAVRNRQGETHYDPIRCFGKLAESVTAIKKGARLFVAGKLEISSFTTEGGNKQMSYRVTAETYRILGHGKQTSVEETRDDLEA